MTKSFCFIVDLTIKLMKTQSNAHRKPRKTQKRANTIVKQFCIQEQFIYIKLI